MRTLHVIRTLLRMGILPRTFPLHSYSASVRLSLDLEFTGKVGEKYGEGGNADPDAERRPRGYYAHNPRAAFCADAYRWSVPWYSAPCVGGHHLESQTAAAVQHARASFGWSEPRRKTHSAV